MGIQMPQGHPVVLDEEPAATCAADDRLLPITSRREYAARTHQHKHHKQDKAMNVARYGGRNKQNQVWLAPFAFFWVFFCFFSMCAAPARVSTSRGTT